MQPVPPARTSTWMAVGFILIGLAWVIALPAFAGSDEFDHAFRASSVADGHWSGGGEQVPTDFARGDLIPVRSDIARAAGPACARLPYTGPFNCRPAKDLADDEVLIASAASRYNPLYYAVVGTVAKPFHGNAALYAMRIAGLLICAGLFGLAVRSLHLVARSGWVVICLVAAALPTTVYSAAVAAPNGIEMVSGIALWTSLLALATSSQPPRWLYPLVGTSAALLVNMHTLGCFWLALIFVGVAVHVGVRTLLAAVRPRNALGWTTLVLTGGLIVFELAWVMAARTNDPSSAPPALTDSVWPQLPREMALWPLQAIAAYPLRDQPAPAVVYALAVVLLIGLITVGIRAARTCNGVGRSLVLLVIASYVVPVVMTAATYSRFGMTWQGRYGMPYTVGFFILLGFALGNETAGRRILPGLLSTGVVVWVAAHAIGLIGVSLDQRKDHLFVTRTGWNPPSAVLLAALCVAAAICWLRALSGTTSEIQTVSAEKVDPAEALLP